uniref:C2H2-type domain-containing protein n=1 Tax=Ditylenchus dipsaci TaxID=166011 RepID=A0A915E4C1_9BILA
MKKRQKVEKEEEVFADDDAPPVLEAEEGSAFQAEEVVISDEQGAYADDATYVLGEEYFVDNGVLYKHAANNQPHQQPQQQDGKAMEFNFLDSANGGTNICCGLCGEIVPYDLLMNQHLPMFHPEVLSDGIVDLEEIPYEAWLNEKMQNEKMPGGSGGEGGAGGMRYMDPRAQISRPIRSTRTLRRISQIRVNINEMSVAELEAALKRKMVEKMGRAVPVTLVDKQHSQCGICDAIISLNKKFEVVHLVRHFNAWHPSEHKCSGTWLSLKDVPMEGGTGGKPLSTQDFAVIETAIDAADNLQCIWCGMSMDSNALAMHFHEIHPEEIEVPKCNLCLQELVVNARLTEKYGEEFNVTMPDEHHFKCGKFTTKYTSEAALDKAIGKKIRKLQNGEDNEEEEEEDGLDEEEAGGTPRNNKKPAASCDTFSNSRMAFGRRSKPKRTFIQPSLRQATPVNSQYVEAVTDCHWRCKMCKHDIYAAVISAGAIRHYRAFHIEHLQSMQYELCKTRLERVSDGCMEFLHIDLIECLLCRMTFPLHRPFNMCRAIRHLKAKHPSKMPEYKSENKEEKPQPKKRAAASDDVDVSNIPGTSRQAAKTVASAVEPNENEVVCAEVSDPEVLSMLRDNYGNVEFHKAFSIYGGNVTQQIYMLTNVGEEIDEEVVEQIASQFSGVEPTDDIIVVQYPKDSAAEQPSQQPEYAEELEEKMAQKL